LNPREHGAIPTYLSGKAAQQAIQGRSGVSEALIETHQDAALLAFLFMEITGFVGVMKNESFAALHRLLPWGILGFGINLMTGILFFIAVPEQYTQNVALQWKMGLLLLAAVSLLYFTVVDQAWALRPGVKAPVTAKVIAVSTIFLWLGVIYFGRMMPFIGGSF
jgi:hypothetical protein